MEVFLLRSIRIIIYSLLIILQNIVQAEGYVQKGRIEDARSFCSMSMICLYGAIIWISVFLIVAIVTIFALIV